MENASAKKAGCTRYIRLWSIPRPINIVTVVNQKSPVCHPHRIYWTSSGAARWHKRSSLRTAYSATRGHRSRRTPDDGIDEKFGSGVDATSLAGD
jgi:hypothetical protein